MRTSTLLMAVFACVAIQPNFGQEYSSEELDQLFIRNVKHLCEWAKTAAPSGNPVEIAVCHSEEANSAAQAESDFNAWWAHWRDNDEATFDRLSKEWDIERAKLDAQRVAKEKAAAREKAKADRARLVASLSSLKVPDLCKLVRRGKLPEALEELVKRKTFPASETAMIARGEVNLGMSEASMLCALGPPKRANRSVGSWGTHIQYVYDGLNVYTENGKVTSWQD